MSSRTALLRRVRPLKDDDDEEDAYNIMSDSSLGNDAIPKTDSEMEDDDSELGLNDEEEGEAGLDEEVTVGDDYQI